VARAAAERARGVASRTAPGTAPAEGEADR
jgi:hypothetical protein